MKYKIKHLVNSTNGDCLYIYGYDDSGMIAYSVNFQDELLFSKIEIIDEIIIRIGQFKVMSVYMKMFIDYLEKPMLENLNEEDISDKEGKSNN